MNKLCLPLAAVLLALAVGCSQKPAATAAPGAEAAASTSPAEGKPSGAAPTATELKQAAKATQESAATDETPGDASLEKMAAMPEKAQLPGGKWKVGVNYKPVVPAQPTSVEPGQVEVLEVMWLGCPHCAHLEPYIDAWRKKKPAYVKFVQEHVMWGPAHRAHAKLYYTLEALNHDDLIQKAFDEIHQRGNVLVDADEAKTLQMQLAFAKANGISESDFKREFNGFGVSNHLQRAEEIMRRYQIDSVPRIIINGKYETDMEMAGGPDQLLALINDLAAAEKSR
ncbi:MAG TPA: thiol:disulfide interchange protein DsbA/DsbL [Steroidobacteraceae bacterium]|nr:thiol:disulfide interchange protein DsbA/DsbL [Steroidobacteraceae bacterium]